MSGSGDQRARQNASLCPLAGAGMQHYQDQLSLPLHDDPLLPFPAANCVTEAIEGHGFILATTMSQV